MERLNEILHELGISKVKLAKFLGVSRQMIYNYLELDDVNKWPKDKKVLLLNLLGVKSVNDIEKIKVNTDYILSVETRMSTMLQNAESDSNTSSLVVDKKIGKNKQQLVENIMKLLIEKLEEDELNKSEENYQTFKYLYNFLQSMDTSKENKYILAYVAKATGFVKPLEFVFNEEEQFTFESILFSAMTLYTNGGASKSKIAESHRRFVNQIEQKMEEKLSRTMELNSAKVQALKELNYTEINEKNAAEVLAKIVEIQSRKVTN